MKSINTVIEGFFDADKVLDKFGDDVKYDLSWIKNEDLKYNIEGNFWMRPERLKAKGVDLKDYPKLQNIRDLAEKLNGKYKTAILNQIENVLQECKFMIDDYEFVFQYADLFLLLDNNLSKLGEIEMVYLNPKKDKFEIAIKGNCESELSKLIDTLQEPKKYVAEYSEKRDVTWILRRKK